MVQKFIFDPRTLIDEEKENEKKKVQEVLTEQEEYDKILERETANAERIKNQEEKQTRFGEAFDEVKDILKEVNYFKKYGGKKYLEEKRKEDPDDPIFDSPTQKIKKIKEQFSDLGAAFNGEFKGEAKGANAVSTYVKVNPQHFYKAL